MPEGLLEVARTISATRAHTFALYVLSNVPGMPPIIQTVHLLSVSAIMGSIVMIDLRVLGVALSSQPTPELVRRLMPWTWSALPFLAASGLVFIVAQPHRYASNPVFGIKFALLVPALALAGVFHATMARDEAFWSASSAGRAGAKIVAAVSLLLWIGVAMAGRWIAYADYLFPE